MKMRFEPFLKAAELIANVVVAAGVLLVVYAVVPVTPHVDGGWVARLIIGVVATIALISWQVRALARSRRPVVRFARALVTSILFLLVVFATTYVALASATPSSFNAPIDKVGALYFSMTTLATVGYGDIAPVSHAARIVVTLQMALDLAVLAISTRLLFRAASERREQTAITN
jgi:voltage-gated potassium channel